MLKEIVLPLAGAIVLFSCGTMKKELKEKKLFQVGDQTLLAKDDSVKKLTNKVRPYREIITDKAIKQKGLFTVYQIEDRYYFEIPDSLLNLDILIVNRVAKAPSEARQDFFAYAGDEIGENVVQFSRGPNNKLFIKRISYRDISRDSSENGMYRSVENSNMQPIIADFGIKAFSPDSAAVIEVTEFIKGDNNDILFFNVGLKKLFSSLIGVYQADKSYIEGIKSFPLNVEIHTVKTFVKDGDSYSTFTYELNSSLVLLPKKQMKPRYDDERVGYFTRGYADFDDPKGIKPTYMITRWRLEPKKEDVKGYIEGKLVEPKNPIIFYIDPATPKKWVPYLIQGVNDWQKAFEKAGFRNAIYALEAPVTDTSWSLDDARHNAIVYKASQIPNAYGPKVSDPRTGEILESHIGWFHNVSKLIHDWYMIQAGAIDPRARKMQFDDSLMGQLIRFVSSHEVGHTLGLMHNFGASSTVSVDSLRNKRWVEENGFCPSIMDYARFNYVAQPEDSISEKGIFPRIGKYDEWAIEFGYRWFPDFPSRFEEKSYFNKWVSDKTGKDKRLWFGSPNSTSDLRCQSEDLGDNAMKASYYGIKNLKIVTSNLIEWTKEPNENYDNLAIMQKEVFAQYNRYILHVVNNIGSWMGNLKTVEQEGDQYEFSSREWQRDAVKFLQEQLFTTPEWTVDKKIFKLVGGNGYFTIIELQQSVLDKLFSINRLGRLLYFENNEPKDAYTVKEFLNDLKSGIWSELKGRKPIDMYRRNLQKAYLAQLFKLQNEIGGTLFQRYTTIWGSSDLLSIIKGQMQELLNEVNRAIPLYKDKMSQLHLIDVKDRLKESLALKVGQSLSVQEANSTFNELEVKDYFESRIDLFPEDKVNNQKKGCWDDNLFKE